MKQEGAYLVPTLSTYVALAEEGVRLGWSPAMLLIIDGDPTRGVSVLAEPERSLRLVMKGGRVYRDKLMDVETA